MYIFISDGNVRNWCSYHFVPAPPHIIILMKRTPVDITGCRLCITHICLKQGCTECHLNILGGKRVMWRKFRTEDPRILGAVVQKFSRHGDLALGICAPLS